MWLTWFVWYMLTEVCIDVAFLWLMYLCMIKLVPPNCMQTCVILRHECNGCCCSVWGMRHLRPGLGTHWNLELFTAAVARRQRFYAIILQGGYNCPARARHLSTAWSSYLCDSLAPTWKAFNVGLVATLWVFFNKIAWAWVRLKIDPAKRLSKIEAR